jgi:PAS domain S-box-containing protein
MRHTALSDPDFSSVAGGVDAGPYANVYSALRPLNREHRPLIETSGVNRVLQRGRVVTVIRDYSSDSSEQSVDSSSIPSVTPKQESLFGNYRSVFSADNIPSIRRDYEEYEQHPCSPWAQSPAPSPAIQTDEERNPFFASDEQQVEESFNPAISPRDYSQELQVEAIGIDCASTVIHIPLIHPTISQPMQSLRMTPQSKHRTGNLQRSNTIDLQRMAPIAILSVLTSVVPYPNNLVHSLRLLGPHLATSFSIAQQFSAFRGQAVRIRQRVPDQGETVVTAPMTVELMSIEDVVNTGFRRTSDMVSDTVTSPSEYSGRSKNSPLGSLSGTPGWELNTSGTSHPRSAAGTPSIASERNNDYFEAQKRFKRGSHTVNSAHGSSTRLARQQTDTENMQEKGVSEDNSTPGENIHHQSRQSSNGKDDKLQQVVEFVREDQTPTPSRSARPSMAHLPDYVSHSKPHTLLHSYGADFESSFGGLSTATPGEATHTRRASHTDDMPPPSERLLRLIIDSVPVQIFTAQPETGQLSWVNAKLLNYRGQDSRQVLGDPWQAIHPDDHAEFLSVWHRSLRTTQQMSQKVRMRNKEGKYRWFYVKCLPLKTPQQKVVHWIGTMMDFHEQHMAEVKIAHQKETEASQAKYKALANSSPQIVFSAQKAKGITFCNTQWLQYSGQIEREALGQGFLEHVHPDDLVKCRFPIFEDGSAEPVNVPTSIPAEPRRTISASAMSSGASSETAKPSSDSDSTASPPSQTAAIMPQRKLSELASVGILKVSRDTDGRPSYSTEVRLKSKDGKFRWHLVRVLLAEAGSQDNDEGTWYGTCTDINDHKTLERDLKETMDEKSRFLSNMSHEIRTPLNGITGMVNFLMDSNLTSEQMEHVNIIRTSTEGLRGLINDILDLSKAEAGMITLKKDWLYPRALIEEVNDLTSTMAIDKGLELNYLVDEDVPPIIKGDKFRIRQILLNTVGNAIKFTQKGEVFVRCSQLPDEDGVLKPDESFIKFDVIDTGRGFTDQEAKFLFKRFSQIDGSSTRQHGGSGLGLVISRQLAQLHGGDMSASGVPNKGSTFTFVIQAGLMSEKERLPHMASDDAPALESSVHNAKRPDLKALPSLTKTSSSSIESRLSAKYGQDISETPSHLSSSPDAGRQSSPSVSSASSDPSVCSAARSGSGSAPSARSSASSFIPESLQQAGAMKLSLPLEVRRPSNAQSPKSDMSDQTAKQSAFGSPGLSSPPMFSILVVASLKYSREATVQHITKTLPKNVPHQITARESLDQCRGLLGGLEPITFSHVVINLQDVAEIIALMKQVLELSPSTSVVLISDLAQRKQIIEQAPDLNYDHLTTIRRLLFIFKPLKPSRLGLIFDPQKEREMSTDRNQDSAKQVATNQKQVFEELTLRLGNRDKRVLIVEDNRTNLLVILKFFSKSAIQVDTVFDGVQCTDKVYAMGAGHYSMILCDLHMPNKDGYQTCREIRKWEKKNQHKAVPIIALSANVLDDVYEKCAAAGFNDYMTKPVDFKELKHVLLRFMDPQDPSQPHELMKLKTGESSASASR